MKFKTWLLITEGLIKIPYKVIKPIVDDYFDFFKNVNLGKTKIKDVEKTYKLDLSGTNYDFPNIIPKLLVTYKGLRGNRLGSYNKPNTQIQYINDETIFVTGHILLKKNLYADQSPVDIIEHEVMHFIQDLINIHMSHNKKINYKQEKYPFIKRPEFGGSGPRKLTQNLMHAHNVNFYGYNAKDDKLSNHEERAIEFQTNLSSVLTILIKEFVKSFLSGNLNPSYYSYNYDFIKSIKTKEDFEKNKDTIIKFINNQNEKNKFIKNVMSDRTLLFTYIEKIKNFNKELYDWYLNEIYKNFVTKDIEESKINQIVDEYFFNKNKLSDEDKYLANKINFRNFIQFYKNPKGFSYGDNYTIRHSNTLVETPKPAELIENVSAIYLYDYVKKIIDKFYKKEETWTDSEWASELKKEEEQKYLKKYAYGPDTSMKNISRYNLKNIFWFIKNLKKQINLKMEKRSNSLEELSEKIARFLAEDIAWAYERHYENKKINKKPPTANDILKDFWTT